MVPDNSILEIFEIDKIPLFNKDIEKQPPEYNKSIP